MKTRRATILGFTVFMAGLVLCGVALWLLSSPPQYQATAVIKVEPDVNDISGLSGPMRDSSEYDRNFLRTTFKIIQSDVILGKVVKVMNLSVEWGEKYSGGATLTSNEVMAILKRHLQIAPVRNTWLIGISFTSEDPDEAAEVANAIAKAYQNYRSEEWNQETRKGFEVLRQEFQDEEKKIKIQQTNVDLLYKELAPQILQAQQERTNHTEIHEVTEDLPYWEAKRKLENMLDFHKVLAAKIASESMDPLAHPKSRSLVEVVEAAQPPKMPVGPNRLLGAVLLTIGLFLTVVGFLMRKAGRHPVPL